MGHSDFFSRSRFSCSMRRATSSCSCCLRSAFTGVNPLQFGEAYNYRFDVSEMKDPIIEVVTQSGWKFVPVLTKGKIKK